MSQDDIDGRIRDDRIKRKMTYRQLAKKYQKSFTQIKQILANPKSVSERLEALEKSVQEWQKEKKDLMMVVWGMLMNNEVKHFVCPVHKGELKAGGRGLICPEEGCDFEWPPGEGE